MQNPQTLHTYQNKRTTSAKNAKGLRPFKRSEPKNLRHKHKTSAKNAKGLRPFKRSKPKNLLAQTQNKCKNAKGLRPFKRSEPRYLRHKHKTSAKTRQGFDLSKHPNQNGHIKCKAKANRMPWKNRKMDARKGEGTFFPQEPSAPIIRFNQNKKN